MSVDELAVYLRISPASAWRLLKTGKLARVKIGHRTVVRRVDADDFLARCAQASAA
ncbi:helix-turn-helix domain-containing protein [Methylorubrum populi]|nr:helix-turn-helix domain-containing protein [Methylorubrum populi]